MKNLLVLITLLSLSNPNPLRADDKNTVPVTIDSNSDRLVKCDSALSYCTKYVADLQDENTLLIKRETELVKERDEALKQATDAANSASIIPWYVWTALGGLTGAVLYKELSK